MGTLCKELLDQQETFDITCAEYTEKHAETCIDDDTDIGIVVKAIKKHCCCILVDGKRTRSPKQYHQTCSYFDRWTLG